MPRHATGKLFHVAMMVDAPTLHDLMTAVDRRAFNLEVRAVPTAADAKPAAKPDKPAAGNGAAKPDGRNGGISTRDFILGFGMQHKKFKGLAAGQVSGRTSGSVSSVLTKLRHDKLVRNNSDNTWSLTLKGRKAALAITFAPPADAEPQPQPQPGAQA